MNYRLYSIERLIESKKYRLAIGALEAELKKDKKNARVLYLLSFCNISIGDNRRSEFFLNRAKRIAPNDYEIINLEAELDSLKNKTQTAIKKLNTSLKINPFQEQAHIIKSKIYLENAQLKEAIKCAEAAVRANSNDLMAKNLLVLGLIYDNKIERAKTLIYPILSQDPTDGFSKTNLALIKLKENNIKKSVEILKDTIKEEPNDGFVKHTLKTAIISKYFLIRMSIKLHTFFLRNPKVFEVLFKLYLILVITFAFILASLGLLEVLITSFLLLNSKVYIPSKIFPQITNLILVNDDVGKYFVSEDQKILSRLTVFFVIVGISILVLFFNQDRHLNHLLTLNWGLTSIYLGGLFFDFKPSENEFHNAYLITHIVLIVFINILIFMMSGSTQLMTMFVFALMLAYSFYSYEEH